MSKKFVCFLASLLTFTCALPLAACGGETGDSSPRDYNADVQAVAPENITLEHFVAEENTTYYTSEGLSLWMEVNGEFLEVNYFSLDGSKRVYDNLYLYEDDYFFMLTGNNTDMYASLSDSSDSEYAEEELAEGEEYAINVIKAGIYTVVFDTETLKFDLVYKSEITTPVYYTIKNCSIYTVATSWVEMSVNPNNADEFMIRNFNVEANKLISFYSNTHVSNYKVTLDESVNNKLASARKANVTTNVGGTYDIYINRKTYVVRLELTNPDTATYSCVYCYYDGNNAQFITLQPADEDVPYIFHYQFVADVDFTALPEFHTENYKTYDLTAVAPEDVLVSGNKYHYFRNAGTYNVIINLKTFEITIQKLPE